MVLTNGLQTQPQKIQGNEIKLLRKVIHVSIGFKMGEKRKRKSLYYVKKCKTLGKI